MILKKYLRNILLLILLKPLVTVAQTFPDYQVTAYDTASSGFYFICPLKFGSNPAFFNLNHIILDHKGQMVYYKTFFNGANTSDFKRQSNGMISYYFQGKFFLADSMLNIVDSVSCKNSAMTDAHDMQVLSNGHFLLLGTQTVTMDLSGYPMFNNNGSPGSANASVKYAVIQEQDANKNVVFEWHSKDYYSFGDVDEAFLNNPANVDWTHCNAVEQDQDGNLLLSVRHFNEITKINRTDSTIIWRLGGKANQFVFTNDSQQFKGQHDIRRISNGNITLFDNGNGNAGNPYHPATAKEYTLDEIQLSATLAWNYVDMPNSYSRAMGNVQRLSNGNTLVNYGNRTSGTAPFNCVKPSGQKVMEITFNDTLTSYRAFNYPGLPISFPRPVITCYQSGNQFFLDAGNGYPAYQWSDGSTTQIIPITATGSYQVFVPVGNGGFISAEPFAVSNLNNPCNLSIESEIRDASVLIYPNPVNDVLFITTTEPSYQNTELKIMDCTGRIVYTLFVKTNTTLKIPVNTLAPGFYFLQAGSIRSTFIKR